MPQLSFSTNVPITSSGQVRGTESILAVDDNAAIRAIVAEQMTSLGYLVTQASSGEEALTLLRKREGRFDLLISDIIMPGGMNGVDLARIATAQWPELCVLLVSGYSGSAEVEREAAAFPQLQKPFRKAELARAVRLALEGGGALQAAAE